MVNVTSNVKLSSSGSVPTTGTLQKGYMAFGNFGGENKLYGNVGSDVVDLIGDAKTVLYFQNQSELDTFLQGSDVPVGEWYASIAEKTYEQYGEWAAYKVNAAVSESEGSVERTFNMDLISGTGNSAAFYGSEPFSDGDAIMFGNYAHTRYFLYLNYDNEPNDFYPYYVYMNFKQVGGNQYYVEALSPANNAGEAPKSSLENVSSITVDHLDGNMQNYTCSGGVAPEDNNRLFLTLSPMSGQDASVSGYLVMKEILSDGEPWINWEEIKAMEANNG